MKNYVPQNVLMKMHDNPFVQYNSYEDIFIHERLNFIQAVAHATGFTEDTYTGIDLDLDSIEYILSSALTPSGVTALRARQFINFTATDCKVAYLHICEGHANCRTGVKMKLRVSLSVTWSVISLKPMMPVNVRFDEVSSGRMAFVFYFNNSAVISSSVAMPSRRQVSLPSLKIMNTGNCVMA